MDGYYSDGGALVSDPNDDLTYWSGGHYTFAMFASKTTNSCSTWTRSYLAPVGYVYAIAVDHTNSAIVYAGGDPGVYRTTNGGTNWTDVSSGLTDLAVDIKIDPFRPTTLYAATRQGVFKTTNSGGAWTNIGCANATSLVLDPMVQGTIYCGTTIGVYTSSDSGGTWTSMNEGLTDTNVTCIGIDPDEYLFVGTAGNGLFRWQLNTGSLENRPHPVPGTACWIDPNPVSGHAHISYTIQEAGPVRISLYDASGRLVRILLQAEQQPGMHTVAFAGPDMPAGIYIVHLAACNEVHVTKFIYCK